MNPSMRFCTYLVPYCEEQWCTNLQNKYRTHDTILRVTRLTRKKCHTERPQILGPTAQNLEARDLHTAGLERKLEGKPRLYFALDITRL